MKEGALMRGKVYSKLDEIPRGSAQGPILDGCLVLEGGAFRGLYTQGFLDAMMQAGLNLSCVVGVSAGALSGMNYVSGQIGRSARINLGFRHDDRYIGANAFIRSGSILDVGFLTEERHVLEPFDVERFNKSGQTLVAVATNCLTGEAEYFEQGACNDIMLAVRASATMPYLSPMVDIGGVPYLDGGCACKIPYEWALERGFRRIIVVRTRDAGFRKPGREHSAAFKAYHGYPDLARKLSTSDVDYNRQCEELERLHAEGALLHCAPSQPVEISRLESDLEKLGDLYWLGWRDAATRLEEMLDYLFGSVSHRIDGPNCTALSVR
jgi:predicted patatin/cPLA2 family phospholipase